MHLSGSRVRLVELKFFYDGDILDINEWRSIRVNRENVEENTYPVLIATVDLYMIRMQRKIENGQ